MLETPRERAELLRSGISGKEIEELYIKHNNFRLIKSPVSIEAPAEYSGASVGDVVKFTVGSDIHEGEVRFIEKTQDGDILYIDSFSGWAYKVPQRRIISQAPAKNKIYLTERVELYRGEASCSPLPIHS